MKIIINYGTGVATVPTAALESIDRANKVDVKLLFLLCSEPHLLFGDSRDACIGHLCEKVGCSVGQVEAALAFWRGAGVLDMEDESTDSLAPLTAPAEEEKASAPSDVSEPAPAEQPAMPTVTVTRSKTKMLDEISNYTPEDLEIFMAKQKDSQKFMDECQATWGAMFNIHDHYTIMSLVDEWGFSWDYVISLLAYVAKYFQERENQGKSLNYVHRKAMNNYKEGIITVEALQQKFLEQERMEEFERRIRPMFGLGGRNLTPKEKKYFSTWLYEYKYNIDVIEMAYNIAVDAKGSPNINYINGILKHWYEDGLTTCDEIAAKQQQENHTVRSIKEGKVDPDNARETVEAILSAEPKDTKAPPATHISQDIGVLRRLMNLGNRMLTEGETAAFTKWRAEFRFSYEIIYYAYQITLENRREYSLPYMDAILSKWRAQNLTTIEAIKAYQKGYKEEKQRKKSTPPNAPAREGSFDTEDFFAVAVKRSFGEDFDPAILNQ